jgi:hypothetical protein
MSDTSLTDVRLDRPVSSREAQGRTADVSLLQHISPDRRQTALHLRSRSSRHAFVRIWSHFGVSDTSLTRVRLRGFQERGLLR